MTLTTSPPEHIPALDTLRGLAALAVCLLHSPKVFGMAVLMPHAYIAVDFFFILSGFVLFYRYGAVLQHGSTESMSVTGFIVRRVARLYPLYMLATGIAFVLSTLWLLVNDKFPEVSFVWLYALISGVFMIPAFNTTELHSANVLFPYLSLAWSVFWEMILSLLFVFWAKTRLTFLPLVAAMSFGALLFFTWPQQTVDGGWQIATFHIGGLRALCGFCLGVIIAQIFLQTKNQPSPHQRRVMSAGIAVLLVISGIYIALSRIYTHLGVELVLLAVVFPAIILMTAFSSPAFLKNRPGILLGSVSYSLYLLHGSIGQISNIILKRAPLIEPSPILGLLWLSGTIFICYLCWRYVETPARKAIVSLYDRYSGHTKEGMRT